MAKEVYIREVATMVDLRDVDGVVPILDLQFSVESYRGLVSMVKAECNGKSAIENDPDFDFDEFAKQTSKALRNINTKGYVHGDVKPEHILKLKDGSYVITHFGSALKKNEIRNGGETDLRYRPKWYKRDAKASFVVDVYCLGLTLGYAYARTILRSDIAEPYNPHFSDKEFAKKIIKALEIAEAFLLPP